MIPVNLYATHQWINQYTHPYVNMYCTLKWVNQCVWEKQYATPDCMNNKVILPACTWVYNLPQFEGSHVSVWRDSTAQYNVADHPFLYFIQSQLTVQVLVKLSKYMHIIFYTTDLFVSLSLHFVGLITGVILYQNMHVYWSILI